MIRNILVFGFLIAFASAFSQPVKGYKVKRDHDGDTIVGYLAENVGDGNTGVVFLNKTDTSKIYSDGDYLVIDPTTGVKVKDLTFLNTNRVVAIHGERLYVTSLDSLTTQKDTLYVEYCDGCIGTSGILVTGDTIFIDTASATFYVNYCDGCGGTDGLISPGDTIHIDTTGGASYWQLIGENIYPVSDRSVEITDTLLFDDHYILSKTDILSDVLDNNSFETNSGYIDPPPGFVLFGFTGWSGGSNVDSSHNARTGSLAAEFTTGNLYQSKSLTSGTQYTIQLYSIGTGRVSLCRNTSVCYNFSTGAWVSGTSFAATYYTVPSSTEWQEILLDVTPNSTVSHTFRLDGVGSTWIVDDVYLGLRDDYLEIGSDDIRIKTLPTGTSDTSVVVEDRKLYKRVIPGGSIDTFFVAYSQVQDGGWKYSGDTLYIDTTQTPINYDTLAAYIDIDSIITSTVIDSLLTTINIDSLVTVNVENYLDTNTTFIDTFYVAYGAFPALLSGWKYSGDTIYVDTTIYSDTVTFQFIEVDSIVVTQITIDTILLGTDTIYSITQLQDSLYFNFTSNPSVSAWVGMGDTVSIDTAAMYIWTVGNSGIQNAKFKNSQNYVTGNYGIAIGYQDTMTGSYAFASGWKTVSEGQGSTTVGVLTKATGNGSFAGGYGAQTTSKYYVTASGVSAFNYSSVTSTGTSDASGQASAVLGGVNNNAPGDNTVVLGGIGQTGTKDNTVYVPDLVVDDTAFIGDNTEWISTQSGAMSIGSDNGFYFVVNGVNKLGVGADVVPNPHGTVDLGSSANRFEDGYFNGTAYMRGIQIDIASAASGRVLSSQDNDGTGEWVPISELTGTADTFYYGEGTPAYGWKMSGDSILIDARDSIYFGYGSVSAKGWKGTGDTILIDTTTYPADTIYVKYHDGSGTSGWYGIGDTILIDTSYSIDTTLWQINGSVIHPKSTSYDVAIGKTTASYDLDVNGSTRTGGVHYFNNANNKIQYDGSFGLDIYGYPSTIDFYVSGAKFAEMNNSTSPPYFKPNVDDDVDIGTSGAQFRNAYYDGTVYADGLDLEGLTYITGKPILTIDGTTVKADSTISNLWYRGTGTKSLRSSKDNLAGGNYSIAIGRKTSASGDYSFAGGTHALTGYNVASGDVSFNFQYAQSILGTVSGTYSAVLGGANNDVSLNLSAIIGGTANGIGTADYGGQDVAGASGIFVGIGNNIATGAYHSAIIGGANNLIGAYKNSVIVGGRNITANDSNTVFVPNLNAKNNLYGSGKIIWGLGATASGDYATSVGASSSADGNYAVAIAPSASADGNYAVAIGLSSSADVSDGISVGRNSVASGIRSIAIGYSTLASTTSSIAIGDDASAGTGQRATAIGAGASASATSATALGDGSIASGQHSLAINKDAIASGYNSFSFGQLNTSSGTYSAILGGTKHTLSGNNSAIIGGDSITATESNMVYMPNGNVISNFSIGDCLKMGRETSLPSSPASGWIVNHNDTLKFYNGATWKTIVF